MAHQSLDRHLAVLAVAEFAVLATGGNAKEKLAVSLLGLAAGLRCLQKGISWAIELAVAVAFVIALDIGLVLYVS